MKSKSASNWSAARSEEHYGFKRWGSNHFAVDPEGFVTVQPQADGRSIRVLDVIQEALGMGLQAPMVIRFQDLLHQADGRGRGGSRGLGQGESGGERGHFRHCVLMILKEGERTI